MHSPRRSARPSDCARPDHVGEPAGQVAADHVAVARGADPARHDAERGCVVRPHRQARHRLLEIQQAEIVLAPLAQHHAARLDLGIGIEPVELAGDLVLEVAGEGRDPHRALVLLGPDARGRDIAQGLADPGAGLGEDDLRLALALARAEGGADRGGVVRLLRPRLGARAQELREAAARLALLDRRNCRAAAPAQIPTIRRGGATARGRRASRRRADCGSAASTASAQPQPPRCMAMRDGARVGDRARPAPVRRGARGRLPTRSAAAAAGSCAGGARPSASARPRGVGRQNRAGRAKAKSSSTSSDGNGRTPKRRAVARAWQTIGGSARARRAASSSGSSAISPSDASHAAVRAPATSAGAAGNATARSGAGIR